MRAARRARRRARPSRRPLAFPRGRRARVDASPRHRARRYADQLAANLSSANEQTPRLLLLSDSVALRQHAAKLYGSTALLTSATDDVPVAHIIRDRSAAALRAAVAEHWVFAGASAFVYSSHSGFSRTAAVRAMRDDAIHTCFHYDGALFAEKHHGEARPQSQVCTGPWSVDTLATRHAAGL